RRPASKIEVWKSKVRLAEPSPRPSADAMRSPAPPNSDLSAAPTPPRRTSFEERRPRTRAERNQQMTQQRCRNALPMCSEIPTERSESSEEANQFASSLKSTH